MIRHPLYRPKIRQHERQGTPGGEYVFTYGGQTLTLPGKFVQDPQSPDGQRWIGTRESNRIICTLVCEMANSRCELQTSEKCWGWTPFGSGDPHHVIHKKMGGANTEDRIWVCGEKVRVWSCKACHRDHHNKLYWKGKTA